MLYAVLLHEASAFALDEALRSHLMKHCVRIGCVAHRNCVEAIDPALWGICAWAMNKRLCVPMCLLLERSPFLVLTSSKCSPLCGAETTGARYELTIQLTI
eukprot:365806-Chlamydomonas_euryale.AAC.17